MAGLGPAPPSGFRQQKGNAEQGVSNTDSVSRLIPRIRHIGPVTGAPAQPGKKDGPMPLQPESPALPENHYENVLASARQAHAARDRVQSDLSRQRSQTSLSEREQLILEEERHRRIKHAEALRTVPSDPV